MMNTRQPLAKTAIDDARCFLIVSTTQPPLLKFQRAIVSNESILNRLFLHKHSLLHGIVSAPDRYQMNTGADLRNGNPGLAAITAA